jgi:16S rRNA (adenine1518-N6/adenine1519-N6)-dimethyltransferase
MDKVKAKKHLGQHFLTDKNICQKIANQYSSHNECKTVLEIGPGMGALTAFLLEQKDLDVHVMEIDTESITYLNEHFPLLHGKIYPNDFIKTKLETIFGDKPFAVVGNFPYNISSQIMFKCLEYRNQIPEITGMFQKEVALRLAEKPGSKQYGVISVILQAFYDIEYCFTVDEHVFNPPPKVKSGVIRLKRNTVEKLDVDEAKFKEVIKTAFNQRRKTISNSLKKMGIKETSANLDHLLGQRPEQLSVEAFIEITRALSV